MYHVGGFDILSIARRKLVKRFHHFYYLTTGMPLISCIPTPFTWLKSVHTTHWDTHSRRQLSSKQRGVSHCSKPFELLLFFNFHYLSSTNNSISVSNFVISFLPTFYWFFGSLLWNLLIIPFVFYFSSVSMLFQCTLSNLLCVIVVIFFFCVLLILFLYYIQTLGCANLSLSTFT